ENAPQRGHGVVGELPRCRELEDRAGDLAGGGEQPGGDESHPGSHLPQHRSQQGEEEPLTAPSPAAGDGRSAAVNDHLAQVGGRLAVRFGKGHQSSGSAVKLGSNSSSSTACTSTSASISPAACSASPAPRIDSYCGSPSFGVVKLVRSSCAWATSIDRSAASA